MRGVARRTPGVLDVQVVRVFDMETLGVDSCPSEQELASSWAKQNLVHVL